MVIIVLRVNIVIYVDLIREVGKILLDVLSQLQQLSGRILQSQYTQEFITLTGWFGYQHAIYWTDFNASYI